jgi:hypothetical protein
LFGISKKTVLQLVKEFWIPFLVSVVWTTYAVWGPDVSVKDSISNFGSSFFLASWLTGQIFRVRKQAGVEASFGSVEQRLNHLLGELEAKTQNMVSHITGGDSYVLFFPVDFVGTKILWVAFHKGDYTLPQVKVSITDVEMLTDRFKYESALYVNKFELGDVHRGLNQTVADSEISTRDRFSFKILTHSRNGTYKQDTRFVRVDGVLRFALRITGPSGIVHEQIQSDFPVNAEGKVDWDSSHVELGYYS